MWLWSVDFGPANAIREKSQSVASMHGMNQLQVNATWLHYDECGCEMIHHLLEMSPSKKLTALEGWGNKGDKFCVHQATAIAELEGLQSSDHPELSPRYGIIDLLSCVTIRGFNANNTYLVVWAAWGIALEVRWWFVSPYRVVWPVCLTPCVFTKLSMSLCLGQ